MDGHGRMIRQVARRHLGRRADENAGDINGDVAVTDDDGGRMIKARVEVAEVGMAVVPADEGRGAEDPVLVGAGNARRAIERAADGEHDGVIGVAQFGDREITPDLDVAEESDGFVEGRAFEVSGNILGRLMVRRHPGPDQAKGSRQAIDDVDADLAVELDERRRGIEARGSGTDDGDLQWHQAVPSGPAPSSTG